MGDEILARQPPLVAVMKAGEHQCRLHTLAVDRLGGLIGVLLDDREEVAEQPLLRWRELWACDGGMRDRIGDLIDGGALGGEEREVTVLFVDLRSFTRLSESMPPREVVTLLNRYFDRMSGIVEIYHGIVDKYIGDAIMAFWGAPLHDAEHAIHGVESALAMQKRIRGLDNDFVKRGWPILQIGVGLNNGEMNVGDMGSKFRRAYTVMGDAVNIASRLEGLTKEYGIGILVSENLVKAAQGFVYREIDKVVVKGRHEGIAIFEPIGRVGEVGETVLQEIDRFHKALELYRKQKWDDAQGALKTLLYAAPDNKLYKVYLKRIEQFRGNPPGAAWNGTWVFTTK